jgi:uncharacterized protein YegP (UPF0339 family)
MRKLSLMMALVAAFAFTGVGPMLQAQKKDKNGTIEIVESAKDGKFRITIRNADGKFLAQAGGPSGFATKKEAMKAIDELKMVVSKGTVVEKKAEEKDKDKKEK